MPRESISTGTELFYQDLGEGSPVVLIHGGCMSHRVWESQVAALLEAGYRVVTPDLRGHGRSNKSVSPYTASMFADDIAALTDAIGLDEFALVGWSLGSTVVATFAEQYPDQLSKLVLVSSSIFHSIASLGEDDDHLPIEAMIANQKNDRPKGMERFVAGMFGGDPDEWTVQWLWSIGMQTPMRVAVKTLEIYVDPDARALRKGLESLDVPCAVFHGARDRAATLDEAESIATDILGDGTFVSFAESGHVPFLKEPTRFNDELRAFLDR